MSLPNGSKSTGNFELSIEAITVIYQIGKIIAHALLVVDLRLLGDLLSIVLEKILMPSN